MESLVDKMRSLQMQANLEWESGIVQAMANRKYIPTPLIILKELPKYYHNYKGIWYKYTPVKGNPTCSGIWEISESADDMTGYKATYNADIYRIDECIDKFFKDAK